MDIATTNDPLGAAFNIEATKLGNKEPRVALLHASASILTGDLGKQFEKYRKKYGSAISALGLQPEELAEMFSALRTAVKVSPWMAEVILVGGKQVSIEPETLVGKTDYGYKFTAKVDNLPDGAQWKWEAFREIEGQSSKYIDTSLEIYEVAHISFPEPGEYFVCAVLWDGDTSDAKVIDSATTKVTIKPYEVLEVELSIEPVTEPPHESGCQIRFIAKTNLENKQLPENIRWEWDWGDGEEDTRKGQPHNNALYNDFSHNYKLPGPFTATVQLYDDDTNTLITTATRDIIIDDLGAIQRTSWVRAMVQCGYLEEISRYQSGQWVITGSDRQTFGWLGQSSRMQTDLKWDGNKFSVTWGDGTTALKYTISGTVSDDASTAKTITVREDYFDEGKNWTIKKVLT
ncbi:PKD domain-containing protein, partial [Chloroflexota bacterium]